MDRIRVKKAKIRPEERRKIPCRQGADLVRLPDEIVTDILLRLAVKTLSRFKCVCTSGLWLISDPQFVRSHLKRGSPAMKILTAPPFQLLDCQLLDETRAKDAVMDLGFSAMMLKMRPTILGSCDGLVAFRNNSNMILWNPTTRMFRRLPSLRTTVRERSRLYGIGYDSRSDDHKVIVGFLPVVIGVLHQLTVKVLSLKTNAWRKQTHEVSFTVYSSHERGVYLRDAVHWMVKQSGDMRGVPTIISMNLADESIGEVLPLPDLVKRNNFTEMLGLAVLQSQLALHVNKFRRFDVWIMNEYAVKSSWTKLFTIPFNFQVYFWMRDEATPLAITRSGKVMIGLLGVGVVSLDLQSPAVVRIL